jgi:hypothetical protein
MSVTMAEPTFSPDGKWMWNGEEWIPAPPGSQHEQGSESVYPTQSSVKEKVASVVEKVVDNGNEAAIEQLTILIDQLEEKNTLYRNQKKIGRIDGVMAMLTYFTGFFIVFYPIYTSKDPSELPSFYDLLWLIPILIFVLGIKKRRDLVKELGIKGKPKVRIWHLTTSVKSIEPLLAMHTHHPSMAKYVEIKSEIQSNFIATMLIGAAGTAVGVGALTVIASQMKKK